MLPYQRLMCRPWREFRSYHCEDHTPIIAERYSREPLVAGNPHVIVVCGLASSAPGFSGPIKSEFYIRVSLSIEVVGPTVIKHRFAVSCHLHVTVPPRRKPDINPPVRIPALIDLAKVEIFTFRGITVD